MEKNKEIYVSLDIETSGFDPLKEDILEVGFVKFAVFNGKFKVLKKWTKVFRNTKPVSPYVLNLTGIKPSELSKGEEFSEWRGYLQKEFDGAIIVGHNVIFDTKFLEVRGIKFSGLSVDTLDLAQIFLPTHHSYNLENLANLFGIKHKNAHRALADAVATLHLLKKFVGLHAALPDASKKELAALVRSANLPYAFFEKVKLKAIKPKKPKAKKLKLSKLEFNLKGAGVLSSSVFEDRQNVLAQLARKFKEGVLIALPKIQDALDLCKEQGYTLLSSPSSSFDAVKFKRLVQQGPKDPSLARFLMKLSVWQSQNWQKKSLQELNFSFYGGQFLPLVSGAPIPKNLNDKVLVCDFDTLLKLSEISELKKRKLILSDIEEFESYLSTGSGKGVSWGFVTRSLRQIYDPETQVGVKNLSADIEQALVSADLFFGLAKGLVQKMLGDYGNLKLSEGVQNSYEYIQISQAAENFIAKISDLNSRIESEDLKKAVLGLKEFFSEKPGTIKWIEISEWRCAFQIRELEVAKISKSLIEAFFEPVLLSSSVSEEQRGYFVNRLGISNLEVQDFSLNKKTLFKNVKSNVLGQMSPSQIESLKVSALKNSPAAVLVSGQKEADSLFAVFENELKNKDMAVQSKHGGSNKLFNNFVLGNKKLLLASAMAVSKFINSTTRPNSAKNIEIKAVIFTQLPLPWATDPYFEALIAKYGENFLLAKGFYNLTLILKFFFTPKLKKVDLFLHKNQLIYNEKLQILLRKLA